MPRPNRGYRLELNRHGAWEIRWSENRRSLRKSTGLTSRPAAELAMAKFVQERAEAKRPENVTIGRVLDEYMANHVIHGPVIDKGRQAVIVSNLRAYFGPKPCSKVVPAQVVEYQRLRRAGEIGRRPAKSAGTCRRELGTLIAALNLAVKSRLITAGERPHIPMPAAPGPKDLWLTEAEVQQLQEAADRVGGAGGLFVHIALATAARRHSIESLSWSQIDFDAGLIQFNQPGRQRTRKRRVAVPISNELAPRLREARERTPGDFVLGSTKAITKKFDTVCRAAYQATGNSRFLLVTPHTLRHTWATLAARAGVSMFEVAGVLGDSLTTVQRNYLHHSPDHLRNAVNFQDKKNPQA